MNGGLDELCQFLEFAMHPTPLFTLSLRGSLKVTSKYQNNMAAKHSENPMRCIKANLTIFLFCHKCQYYEPEDLQKDLQILCISFTSHVSSPLCLNEGGSVEWEFREIGPNP